MIDLKSFSLGLWKENPVFYLMLGLCPLLAVSASLKDALGMGAAFIFVLTGANITVSIIRRWVPAHIRIPVFIIVIATFVTIVDYSMAAFLPPLHRSLGVYLPLMVVNCIILGRAEAFASKNNIVNSALDGLGMGLGFTLAILAIAVLRELPGQGTVFGIRVLGKSYTPFLIMIMPPGAFLVIGFLIALKNSMGRRKNKC
ncbi:MAG: electron transport complex subunit E [Candidatus Omnitrophica bacterium]|nr:electron transport complex subunit E [Candidatus Omnitrophota bacterium]